MPEEDANEAIGGLSLHAAFDAAFMRDLFTAARTGNTVDLSAMLQKMTNNTIAWLSTNTASGAQAASQAERAEKCSDLMSTFLSKARDTSSPTKDTLLGEAAAGGHVEALQLLMQYRADSMAKDDHGFTVLHRAAESGRLLAVLVVLDRMQSASRALSVSEFTNNDGETPDMLAAFSGSSDICRAFELFGDMQTDAEQRQTGANFSGGTTGIPSSHYNAGFGDLLSPLDLLAPAQSAAGQAAAARLRRLAAGCGVVKNLHKRIPEDENDLRNVLGEACNGIHSAEEHLLKTVWNPSDPGLQFPLRGLVVTAEVRAAWQRLRAGVIADERCQQGLCDFWQTHLSADTMIATLMNGRGQTFQVLLTVLWLYTREAWLRHVMDALVTALYVSGSPGVTENSPGNYDGATGACIGEVAGTAWRLSPAASKMIMPLADALAPCIQMVQSALSWFEEAGIRHQGMTYRPLSVPIQSLKQLEKYVAQRKTDAETGAGSMENSAWVSLSTGAFFSSMSSRAEALKRLSRTRCNVLLVIRPDDTSPIYPKQMTLRGNAVDDVLFPMGSLFRATRVAKTVSSDLDPEACQTASSRWPVHIVELTACDRFADAVELLDRRGEFSSGEFDALVQQWVEGASPEKQADRQLAAGELLTRCAAHAHSSNVRGGDSGGSGQASHSGSRLDRAAALLTSCVPRGSGWRSHFGCACALGARPLSDVVVWWPCCGLHETFGC
jgi:hypothetical protein